MGGGRDHPPPQGTPKLQGGSPETPPPPSRTVGPHQDLGSPPPPFQPPHCGSSRTSRGFNGIVGTPPTNWGPPPHPPPPNTDFQPPPGDLGTPPPSTLGPPQRFRWIFQDLEGPSASSGPPPTNERTLLPQLRSWGPPPQIWGPPSQALDPPPFTHGPQRPPPPLPPKYWGPIRILGTPPGI